jgi:predicted metal-dependent hydrolase
MKNSADLDIQYRISPRRKTIGLQVTTRGQVVVTLPRGTSKETLHRALAKHQAWIEAKVAERRAAWERLREGEVYFLGQPHRLTLVPGVEGPVTLNGGEIWVPRPEGAEAGVRLQDWLAARARTFLKERLRHWAAVMKLTPGPVELRNWKRRWGECHPQGRLRFNWRLIMCPPPVIDYVVVHELAHLTVPGHNRRFWALVEKVLPDYAARRAWLNRDGSPLLLWQPEF